jgi:hypothetical protein
MIIEYNIADRQKLIDEYKSQGLSLKTDKRTLKGNYLEFVKPEDIIQPQAKISIREELASLKSELLTLKEKTATHEADLIAIKEAKEIKK